MALAVVGCGGAAEWDDGAGAGGSAGESASERGSEPATGGYRLVPPDEYPLPGGEPEPAHPEPEGNPPEVEPELPTLGSPCTGYLDCQWLDVDGVSRWIRSRVCHEGRCAFYCGDPPPPGLSEYPDPWLERQCRLMGHHCAPGNIPAEPDRSACVAD